jgi:hypothetical protein
MKKNLLNESEVRKFMKFANLQSLTENFVDNLEEEELEEGGMAYGKDDAPMTDPGEEGDAPMSVDAGEPEGEDAGLELGPEDEEGMDDMEDVEAAPEGAAGEVTIDDDDARNIVDLLGPLVDKLESAIGPADDEEGIDDMEDVAGVEGDDMAPMTDPGEEGDAPMSVDAGPPPDDELEEANIYLQESARERQERIISEVTSRVAKRLLRASRPKKRRAR